MVLEGESAGRNEQGWMRSSSERSSCSDPLTDEESAAAAALQSSRTWTTQRRLLQQAPRPWLGQTQPPPFHQASNSSSSSNNGNQSWEQIEAPFSSYNAPALPQHTPLSSRMLLVREAADFHSWNASLINSEPMRNCNMSSSFDTTDPLTAADMLIPQQHGMEMRHAGGSFRQHKHTTLDRSWHAESTSVRETRHHLDRSWPEAATGHRRASDISANVSTLSRRAYFPPTATMTRNSVYGNYDAVVAQTTGGMNGLCLSAPRDEIPLSRLSSQDDNESSFQGHQSHSPLRRHSTGEILGSQDDSSDNDDYGFLTTNTMKFGNMGGRTAVDTVADNAKCHMSAATMNKSKASQATKLLPKKWRRSKREVAAKWTNDGGCTWRCGEERLVLFSTSLLRLSALECEVLQKLALPRLQQMDLGVQLQFPKDQDSKRKTFTLKKRSYHGGGLLDWKNKSKDSNSGQAFGISLSKCIHNDTELHSHNSALSLRECGNSALLTSGARKSSSSSCGEESLESTSDENVRLSLRSDQLLDALALSSSAQSSRKAALNSAPALLVPYVVQSCFKHIETYGLHTVGIFRIGASRKRVRQLREEFDSRHGDVKLSDQHGPHDVAALLKEFFRDLPDPLLTRHLYAALLATRKLGNEERRANALHLLITLLPKANRDTLWSLLRFLSVIAQNASDHIDHLGNKVEGNKMDVRNLATILGPNILHKASTSMAKGATEQQFTVDSVARADERNEVIDVLEELINRHNKVFEVSADEHNECLRQLEQNDPAALDLVLDRLLHERRTHPNGGRSLREKRGSLLPAAAPPTHLSESLRVPDVTLPWQQHHSERRVSPNISPRISPSPKARKSEESTPPRPVQLSVPYGTAHTSRDLHDSGVSSMGSPQSVDGRDLDVNGTKQPLQQPQAAQWQKERWRHWESIMRYSIDDDEPETLV